MKLAGGPHVPRLMLVLLLGIGIAAASATGTGRAASAEGPVERAVTLLQDLMAKLKRDGENEQAVYDKYACWCEKTTARKAEAIVGSKAELRSLAQEILSQKGKVATLASEIRETTAEIRANEEAQQEATSIRQKENAAYVAEVVEMKQALAALEKAVMLLRDAAGSSASAALLQRRTPGNTGAKAAAGAALVALQGALLALPAAGMGAVSPRLVMLRRYGEGLTRSRGQAEYTPQSATITGILDDMYSTFSRDLEATVGAEATKNRGFEELLAVKQQELLGLQEAIKRAEEGKTEVETMLAEATQAYDDTEEQLQADIKFFDTAKPACEAKTEGWQSRKTLRSEELEGIAKALQILTSDEARALFSKAIEPGVQSFLQVGCAGQGAGAAAARRAYEVLGREARRARSLRLAGLATLVRSAEGGHFDEVLTAVDMLIQELKQEEESDIKKRDQCLEDFNKINGTAADVAWKVQVNQAAIDKLEATITRRKEEQAATLGEIEAVVKQINEMNTTRKEENDVFLQAKSDDERAVTVLTQAKDALAAYYSNNSVALGPLEGGEGTALWQQGPETLSTEDDAPDADFSHKGSRKGQAKGIISILTFIIEDLQSDSATAKKEEEVSQMRYEEQYTAAKDLQTKLETKKINLDMAISQRESERNEETTKKVDNEAQQKENEDSRTEIQPDCDWVLGAFAERREKRKAETEGLRQAKEYLAGFQPSAASSAEAAALLQGGRRPTVAQPPGSSDPGAGPQPSLQRPVAPRMLA